MSKVFVTALAVSLSISVCAVIVAAQEAQQQDTRDAPTLDLAIQQDIGAYLNTMRQLPELVAILNNDQHALIVLQRTKLKWWEDCVKDQTCVDWVRGK